MTYEDFFSPAEVSVYKRVKGGAMRIASVAREVAAEMVEGHVQARGKAYVRTPLGLYRLCMSHNSDNTTEIAAHERHGATTVVMGDPDEMDEFFVSHGLLNAYPEFVTEIGTRL